MKYALLLSMLLITLDGLAQDKKDLALSLSAGFLNSPYYANAHAKGFYGVGFDYHLGRRHVLAVNYWAGKHTYYDDVLSNDPQGVSRPDGTNTMAEYRTFALGYKYKLVDNAFLDLIPGLGAGILTHTREYPYREVNKSYPRISSWSDLVFPVSVEVNFKVSTHWQAGLTGTLLIHPDYPIPAFQFGPRLAYIIQ